MNKTSRIASVATATVLGAGAALAVAATPAHATDLSVWDRVANCESSGNWKISTGNGFYGGVQFTHSTWIAYGGGAYANNANGATKAEQIAIARRVLASQGPGAWPVCSKKAGLTRSTGGASSSALPVGGTATVTSSKARAVVSTKKATTKKKATTTKKVTVAKVSAKGTYVVKRGDSLAKIAKAHGESWKTLWSKNKTTIKNPNMIRVGQIIKL